MAASADSATVLPFSRALSFVMSFRPVECAHGKSFPDDHTLVAEACQKLLEPDYEIVGVVPDGRALLQAAAKLRPDVVIADIAMPLLNGLDAREQVKRENRSIKLVFLTMSMAPDLAAEAFRRGASGYVLKHCSADELLVAVRSVLRRESYLTPLITKDAVDCLLLTGATYSKEKRISSRQSEVVQLLAEGRSMKEVAYTLNVKPGTVAYHKYKAMESLGFRSHAELIEYAMRNNMIAD